MDVLSLNGLRCTDNRTALVYLNSNLDHCHHFLTMNYLWQLLTYLRVRQLELLLPVGVKSEDEYASLPFWQLSRNAL